MNDAVFVCMFECGADLDGNRNDAREICWARLGKTRSCDQFHHEEWQSAGLADIVNSDDMRVIECSGRACFAN